MRGESTYIGQPVRSLQTMLSVISKDDKRFQSIIPDGLYGPETMNAVATFQRIQGLPVTGITNQVTWDSISDKYNSAKIRQDKAEKIEILLEPGQTILPGETNPYVYLAQGMLAYIANSNNGVPSPTATGEMDAQTVASLIAFQNFSALANSGQLDRETWLHLVRYFTLNVHIFEREKNN